MDWRTPRTSASHGVDGARWRAVWSLAAVAALVLAVGCTTDGIACQAGDYQRCDCGGKPIGYAQCDAQGAAYGACDCSGNIPPGALADASDLVGPNVPKDAGDAGDASEAGSALLGLGAPCDNDAQCATHQCFQFNARGPHCTHPCTSNGDCELPSPGCSGMGVCKSP